MVAVNKFLFYIVLLFQLSLSLICNAQDYFSSQNDQISTPTPFQRKLLVAQIDNVVRSTVLDPNLVFTLYVPTLNCSDGSESQKIRNIVGFMNEAVGCVGCSVNNSVFCPENIMPVTVSQLGRVDVTNYQLLLNTMVNSIDCLSEKIGENVTLIEFDPNPQQAFVQPRPEMPILQKCQVQKKSDNVLEIDEVILLDDQLSESQRTEILNSLVSILDIEMDEFVSPESESNIVDILLQGNSSQSIEFISSPMLESDNISVAISQSDNISIAISEDSLRALQLGETRLDVTQLSFTVSLSFSQDVVNQQIQMQTTFQNQLQEDAIDDVLQILPPVIEDIFEPEVEIIIAEPEPEPEPEPEVEEMEDLEDIRDLQEELLNSQIKAVVTIQTQEVVSDNSGIVHPMGDLLPLFQVILGL